jgi:hypothetical protein
LPNKRTICWWDEDLEVLSGGLFRNTVLRTVRRYRLFHLMFVYPTSRAESKSLLFVSMVINCPTLLDIYIQSVSWAQPANFAKKSLGVIKIRVIKKKVFTIVPFLCQILKKPTYLRQDQHI